MQRIWLLVALCFLLVQGQAGAQGLVERAECALRLLGHSVSCGTVALLQDYDDAAAGTLELYFTVIHSRASSLADPLVYLVGGPGSSGTSLAEVSFHKYLRALSLSPARDIVVIDHRGTGQSQPDMECLEVRRHLDDILQSRHKERAQLLLAILGECQQRLSESDIALGSFHSETIAQDIAQVLYALGYKRWNLLGVSYGTRLALEIMRLYPQQVRSAILDSVYPPQADIFVDNYFHGEAALAALFAACRADTSCQSRYPQLGERFYALYARLNEMPLEGTVERQNGVELRIEISGYRLYDWIFSWLYDLEAIVHIPYFIAEIEQGRMQEVARVGLLFESSMTNLSLGMHYSVQCQEEFALEPPRGYTGLLQAHPHLRGYLGYQVEGAATLPQLCALWLAEAAPPRANEPVESVVPTLLLSGGFDPITPAGYAEQALETLPVASHVLLPHAGHGVLRADACALSIAQEFIRAPYYEPDASCAAIPQALDFR